MSVESIRKDVGKGQITFGSHLLERMHAEGVSIDQVLAAILTGTVRKREKDEHSDGKFTKYTLVGSNLMVVVKNCHPAFIITVRRRR